MDQFCLTNDDDTDTPTRPVRLVSQGLAPTADVPASATKGRSAPASLVPCPQCGARVLHVQTAEGPQVLAPPEHGGPRCYVVQWDRGTPQPTGTASRALAQHRCGGEESEHA